MADSKQDASDSGVSRLIEEISHYLEAHLDRIAHKAGGKLTELTGHLGDITENGGQLPAIGARLLKGENPVKALASEKTKGAKDSVMDKAKGAFGKSEKSEDSGDGDERKPGDPKVTNIIETLDVGLPLRTVYDHWTQYDAFPGFTKGVSNVSEGDDETQTEWKVKVWPSTRSFTATVLEQVPDERIVWTSEGQQATVHGVVSFHELTPTLTRIVLVVEYYPAGFLEKTGNIWRAQGRRLRLDFKNFQRFATISAEKPDGWRGEIRDGEVVVSHEDALEREQSDQDDEDEDDREARRGRQDAEAADWDDGADADQDEDDEEDEDEDDDEDED